MKRLLVLGLIVCMAIGFSGCLNITEEVHLNEDGSGKYQLVFDMGGIYENTTLTALMEEMTRQEGEIQGFNPLNAIDTVINFNDAAELDGSKLKRPEFWKKVNLHLKFDEMEETLLATITFDFQDLSDIDYFYQDLYQVQKVSNLAYERDRPESGNDQTISFENNKLFELDKRSFTRNPIMNENQGQASLQQVQFLKNHIPNGIYKTIYYLPGKIRKSTFKNATIEDNVIMAEYPLIDIYEGETALDGEVKFK